jgi:hypothetical protein
MEDFDLQKSFSAPFSINVAGVTNTIQLGRRDSTQ